MAVWASAFKRSALLLGPSPMNAEDRAVMSESHPPGKTKPPLYFALK